METAYIVKGVLKNHNLIELTEPIPLENGYIKIIIEPIPKKLQAQRIPGLWKGRIKLSDDFYEPLDDFKDYM